jgi:hypothetical protein
MLGWKGNMPCWLVQDTEAKHAMLVQDTESTLEANLHKKQGPETPEQRTRTFHQRVLKGDLRGTVRYLTDGEKGPSP